MSVNRPHVSAAIIMVLGSILIWADAHGQIAAGAQSSWGSRMDFGVGARVMIQPDKSIPNLECLASIDHFFPGDDYGIDLKYWELTLGLSYNLVAIALNPTPFLGAGFTLSYLEASTSALGTKVAGQENTAYPSLWGGVIAPLGRIKPFVEGRFTAGEGGQFVVTVGARLF